MTAAEARGDARVLRALASGTRASAEAHWSPRTEMFTSAIERADRFDRAAVALEAFADGIDAEARGRAHGLLAAAMLLTAAEQKNRACVEPRASAENWWKTRANAFSGAIGGIERLAAEASRDE